MVRGASSPPKTPIFSMTMNQATMPYRPWVPGSTWRIMHLENCSGVSAMTPVAASPVMPVPLAEPTQQRPTARAEPR